jgi:hypothetical protein
MRLRGDETVSALAPVVDSDDDSEVPVAGAADAGDAPAHASDATEDSVDTEGVDSDAE